MKLEIVKKNRLWFEVRTKSGYKGKLKIDKNTESLEVGEHDLLFKDISVRNKYGCDLKFELPAPITTGYVTLSNIPYNIDLAVKCRKLGGEWCSDQKAWIFSALVEEEVDDLEELYNRDFVAVEITAKEEIFRRGTCVSFLGYPICSATGRDSGAKLCKGVAQIKGRITSAGSCVNWGTDVNEGSAFRLLVPNKLLEADRKSVV